MIICFVLLRSRASGRSWRVFRRRGRPSPRGNQPGAEDEKTLRVTLHADDATHRYVAIHLRSLEGTCVGRLWLEGMTQVQRVTARDMGREVTAEDLCTMDGGYVKAALRMDSVPRGWPIILITDGQNTQKAGKLRKNWHAVETHATAYADLVLAVRSAYFIGNPASSFSANVVMIRRALGAAPTSTNLRVMDFPRPGSYNEQFA